MGTWVSDNDCRGGSSYGGLCSTGGSGGGDQSVMFFVLETTTPQALKPRHDCRNLTTLLQLEGPATPKV